MNDNKELHTENIEAMKEEQYKQGYEDGFNHALSLMQRPINIPDNEVKDKISNVDLFLRKLEW